MRTRFTLVAPSGGRERATFDRVAASVAGLDVHDRDHASGEDGNRMRRFFAPSIRGKVTILGSGGDPMVIIDYDPAAAVLRRIGDRLMS